jgi:serine/threonine protein kinase
MYELVTGFRPYRAASLTRLLNQIIYATAAPVHTLRADVPEELEEAISTALQKDPQKRYANGGELASALTKIYRGLREQYDKIDNQEHFDLLRRLKFFHDFSQTEIWELLRASEWGEYEAGQAIARQGEMDDRFYVIVSGQAMVEVNEKSVGRFGAGDCFGEAGYITDAKRTSTIKAIDSVTVLSVSATLLEQVSSECQLRFNKVFLRSLILRLQGD